MPVTVKTLQWLYMLAHTFAIPELRRLRQVTHKFKASLCYIVSLGPI